jgi:hypothetical protein
MAFVSMEWNYPSAHHNDGIGGGTLYRSNCRPD